MKKLLYLGIAAIAGVFVACNGEADGDGTDVDSLDVDTTDTMAVDTSIFMDDSGYVDETLETENIIEAKYGVQWDFCDCVVKNDSAEQAFFATDDEAQQDKIMTRWDEIDKHCKTLLTAPNTTPEERDAHERKVRKCLRDAK